MKTQQRLHRQVTLSIDVETWPNVLNSQRDWETKISILGVEKERAMDEIDIELPGCLFNDEYVLSRGD